MKLSKKNIDCREIVERNVDFGQNFRKISIFPKSSKISLKWKFRKISILVEIFEKFGVFRKFRKTFDFGQIFTSV